MIMACRCSDTPANAKNVFRLWRGWWDFGTGALGDMACHNWDIAFWAERLREERFDYSEEELRAYFPLPRVLQGLFSLSERLFGIRVVAADGEVPVWHPDVRYFQVKDDGGADIAAFYLDPFSRPQEKRGGAWMDECLNKNNIGRDFKS